MLLHSIYWDCKVPLEVPKNLDLWRSMLTYRKFLPCLSLLKGEYRVTGAS